MQKKGTIRGTKAEFEQLVTAIVTEVYKRIDADMKQASSGVQSRTKARPKSNPFYPESPQTSFGDALFSSRPSINGNGSKK